MAYQKKGFYDLALSDYNRAIDLDPESDMAYNNRGFLHLLMGDDRQAERDIRKAIEISPCNIFA
ncbi:MAG: tetratricopeptide repeat protein [Desulfomicrobium escambiense]|nr:tetratricopeptide repeat protein [Desulfomicrobium escambiense]